MKKIFLILFILINSSSCNVISSAYYSALEFSKYCQEAELFPSKSYDELINAKDFFQDNNDKYELVSDVGTPNKTASLNRIDTSCCSCAHGSIAIIKNKLSNNSEIEESVGKIGDYIPEKVFFIFKKDKLIYEFNIKENDLFFPNYHNYKLAKKGKTFSFARGKDRNDYINIESGKGKDGEINSVILLKNQQNKEILIMSSKEF